MLLKVVPLCRVKGSHGEIDDAIDCLTLAADLRQVGPNLRRHVGALSGHRKNDRVLGGEGSEERGIRQFLRQDAPEALSVTSSVATGGNRAGRGDDVADNAPAGQSETELLERVMCVGFPEGLEVEADLRGELGWRVQRRVPPGFVGLSSCP